jgi:DNA invertase Pin-like site-specific DNA recombinase
MANVGYARISTMSQNLDLQIDDLKSYGCLKIFSDVKTGSDKDREQLKACLEFLREGDTLVIWKLDRLARSVRDLLQIFGDLEKRNIHVKSIKEALDTTTAMGKFTFHIMASMIEMERDIIRERTYAGLKSAMARGRKGGRPFIMTKPKREKLIQIYQTGEHTTREIASYFKISTALVFKILREEKANGRFLAQEKKKQMLIELEESLEKRNVIKI